MTGLLTDAQYRLLRKFWRPLMTGPALDVPVRGPEHRTLRTCLERGWLHSRVVWWQPAGKNGEHITVTPAGRKALQFYEVHWQVPGWETAWDRYGVRS